MFNHCIPYKCNIYKILPAVFLILYGILCAYADTVPSPTKLPRIALLGDSMTWIGGDSCQNPTGWSHILKQSGIADKIDVYARSGATWTNTKSTQLNTSFYSEILHDNNVVYNQAFRLLENAVYPDIIILFAGANDAWFANKRPGIYDQDNSTEKYTILTDPSTVTTLEGSIRLVCDILQTNFPNATLLFVTPLQMSKTDPQTIFKVSEIIEKTASQKGCLVIRPDKETAINHEQEAKSPKYTYDGVHTNPEGARILGNYILESLIPLSHQKTETKNLTTDNSQLITDN